MVKIVSSVGGGCTHINLNIIFGANTRHQQLMQSRSLTQTFKMKIENDVQLKKYTTFRIGGPAQFFCSVTSEAELVEAVAFAHENRLPIFTLGGGSNILVSDKGVSGLVIKMEMRGVEYDKEKDGVVRVEARAGENWDEFVHTCVEKGLCGVENLSYIPGTVGAAPVQNIGAYGVEIKDVIDTVRAYDTQEKVFVTFTNFDCHFDYRDSIFKQTHGRYIIVSVSCILKKDGAVSIDYKDLADFFASRNTTTPTVREVRDAVIEIRTRKLPDVKKVGTAGSFFKNPVIARGAADDLRSQYPDLPLYPVSEDKVKIPLGWVIDKVCNFKGVEKGDVGTYRNQALVLVNNGNATAADVISFAKEIQTCVKEKIRIDVEFEVQVI